MSTTNSPATANVANLPTTNRYEAWAEWCAWIAKQQHAMGWPLISGESIKRHEARREENRKKTLYQQPKELT